MKVTQRCVVPAHTGRSPNDMGGRRGLPNTSDKERRQDDRAGRRGGVFESRPTRRYRAALLVRQRVG